VPLDLLAPLGAEQQLRRNYVHQLRQTINAYLPSYIFVGEALQNALDAIREAGVGPHTIGVTLDFDQRRVTVRDDGRGFPDRPELLFLGGGDKAGKTLAGMVGVGLKVVLFSSCEFRLQARNAAKSLRVDLTDAYRFGDTPAPTIELPDTDHLPDDQTPLFGSGTGTEISYRFPPGVDAIPEQYLRDLKEECLLGTNPDFRTSLQNAVQRGRFPTRLAALVASDLRRFSYLGCTEARSEFDRLTVEVRLIGSPASLGELADLADGQVDVSFQVKPRYLDVSDTLDWAPAPKPVIQANAIGEGGSNLSKMKLGFNVTTYSRAEEFEALLVNARGRMSPDLELFRRLLFPKLKSVTLTIGRIPQFQLYLPGGARRVISARGVVTQHDIDVSSGQNQQYVRCFDLVVDVDADLNYGKTQLTDMHLVANVRRFVNEAYRCTIQNAARNFVGTIKIDDTTTDQFWEREELGIGVLAQKKVPRDENDVIALFFELTGRGHFGEFEWYGLSSKDVYDGRAVIRAPDDEGKPATTHDLRTIEFKLRGASVARDFDREEKKFEEVDLIICYEIGDSPVALYQVVELANSEFGRSEADPYPGVTHILLDTVTGREIQMLPVRDFIAAAYPPDKPAPAPADAEDTEA